MDHVIGAKRQGVRYEVILHTGKDLHDVASLAAHVDIIDFPTLENR